jgi:hypothetical protein
MVEPAGRFVRLTADREEQDHERATDNTGVRLDPRRRFRLLPHLERVRLLGRRQAAPDALTFAMSALSQSTSEKASRAMIGS